MLVRIALLRFNRSSICSYQIKFKKRAVKKLFPSYLLPSFNLRCNFSTVITTFPCRSKIRTSHIYLLQNQNKKLAGCGIGMYRRPTNRDEVGGSLKRNRFH